MMPASFKKQPDNLDFIFTDYPELDPDIVV